MIKNYFFLDDSPLFKGKYVIRFNVDLIFPMEHRVHIMYFKQDF